MGFFVFEQEIDNLHLAAKESKQIKYYNIIQRRVEQNTKEDSLVQSGDTQEWYHLCWERMSDASFVWAVDKDVQLGKWIYSRALEIARKPINEWLGPWFRGEGNATSATLETSHITLALCEAIQNCSDLFSEIEKNEIYIALREKGLFLCEAFCKNIISSRSDISNWFLVILDGFGTAALVLDNEKAIHQAYQWSQIAGTLYNDSDYGESLQYANYATLHLSRLNEMFIRAKKFCQNELTIHNYTMLIPWYVASFLCMKPMEGFDGLVARSFNFGDSSAVLRPSGDVLVQVATYMQKKFPREAGLAAWLFEQTYKEQNIALGELATFGFFNHFQYSTVLQIPYMCEPLSPIEAGLPAAMSFAGGQVILRDSWENTKTALAIQAGYQPYNVTAHRHCDQNSFQLSIGKERMLIDPGHCCYRLNSQKDSIAEEAHSTISITCNGIPIKQAVVGGNVFDRQQPKNILKCNRTWGNVHIIVSDSTALYDSVIEKAIRIWIVEMPSAIFVVDIVKASKPIVLNTHFTANNRDNHLKVNRATTQRLVLRRNDEALKLFCAFSQTDGVKTQPSFENKWNYAHTFYHPLPNQSGQGKEGSALCYNWKGSEGKEHVRIHTLIADKSEIIVGWHVYQTEDNYIRIEAPDKDKWIDVKIENEACYIRQCYQGEEIQLL